MIIKYVEKEKLIKIYLRTNPIKADVNGEIFFRGNLRELMKEIKSRL